MSSFRNFRKNISPFYYCPFYYYRESCSSKTDSWTFIRLRAEASKRQIIFFLSRPFSRHFIEQRTIYIFYSYNSTRRFLSVELKHQTENQVTQFITSLPIFRSRYLQSRAQIFWNQFTVTKQVNTNWTRDILKRKDLHYIFTRCSQEPHDKSERNFGLY